MYQFHDRPGRQLDLRQEPHRSTVGEQIGDVLLRVGRDQDDRRQVWDAARAQLLDEIESAFLTGIDVDEGDIWPQIEADSWNSPGHQGRSASTNRSRSFSLL